MARLIAPRGAFAESLVPIDVPRSTTYPVLSSSDAKTLLSATESHSTSSQAILRQPSLSPLDVDAAGVPVSVEDPSW